MTTYKFRPNDPVLTSLGKIGGGILTALIVTVIIDKIRAPKTPPKPTEAELRAKYDAMNR